MRKIVLGMILAALVFATGATGAMSPNYGGLNAKQEARIVKIIQKRFGSSSTLAVCIARRESGLNPRAANFGDSNGGSFGLFQLNGVHRWAFSNGRVPTSTREANIIFNPRWNTEAAWRLSNHGRSWGPWGYSCN